MIVNPRCVAVPGALMAAAAAAASALAAPPSSPADSTPRFQLQILDPLATPAMHQGAAARIMAFDASGVGYGFSHTGDPAAPMAAVRWHAGTITTLPALSGTSSSHAAAANNAGQVVGWYAAAGEGQGGVLWSGGELRSLGEFMPLAINESGAIAGVVRNSAAPRRHAPAVMINGRITPLPMDRPESHGWVVGVSGAGEVAGSWYAGADAHRAVRWVDGQAQVLPLPDGAHRTEARAINDAGWIVGAAYIAGTDRTAAVLWQGDQAINLGSLDPASPSAWAASVNNRGQIVGVAHTQTGPTVFLWEGGVMHDLRTLIGASVDEPFQAANLVIGDTGHIAGVQLLPDGSSRGFVVVPVPGPSGAALLLAGAALVMRRRSR